MRLWRARTAGVGMLLVVASSACGAGPDSAKVDVTAREFSFEPRELRMKRGNAYEVRMRNEGQLLHDWSIASMPARDVAVHESGKHEDMPASGAATPGSVMLHMAAERGMTSLMTFTPTQAGEYVYYCSVSGHRESGMQGRLVVE